MEWQTESEDDDVIGVISRIRAWYLPSPGCFDVENDSCGGMSLFICTDISRVVMILVYEADPSFPWWWWQLIMDSIWCAYMWPNMFSAKISCDYLYHTIWSCFAWVFKRDQWITEGQNKDKNTLINHVYSAISGDTQFLSW